VKLITNPFYLSAYILSHVILFHVNLHLAVLVRQLPAPKIMHPAPIKEDLKVRIATTGIHTHLPILWA
jgi:hypothetical protein